jgi:hypothetical protein
VLILRRVHPGWLRRVDGTPRCTASQVVIGGLIFAYVGAWAASPLVLHQPSDLDVFFWPSAETAAKGHPLLIYSTNTRGQGPNANGPLGLLPLIPLAAIANRMGWASDIGLRAGVTDAIFALFALLLATTAVRIIESARGAVEWRLAAPCVFLLAPALWISVGDYGHLEQPIELWLVVLAVGYVTTDRPVLAGLALGLAALSRTTALLYMIPFGLLPLANRRIKPSVTILSVSAIVAAAGFAPFFIADGPNAVRSLITYRGDVPIAGGSFWVSAVGTPWAVVAQRASTYLVLTAAVALTAATLWRRPSVATTTAGFFGLLTIVAACFPMLSDATYPYYLLEPYVFGALWWLSRPGGAFNWRLAVPLLLTADAFLAKQGAALPFNGPGLVIGVASSAVLAVVIGLVMGDLFLLHSGPEPSADHSAQMREPAGQATA